MYKPLVRMASGIFAIIFAAAPTTSATAVTTSTFTPSMSTIHGKPASRIVKIGKKSESFPLPVGCGTNGVHSFIGELGPIGKYVETNFAGAITSFPPSGYAGILAGVNNEACDYLSAIGAGSENVIGGSGAAQRAFIGAGQQNAIDGAPYAFIGGGSANLVNGENVDGGVPAYGSIIGAGQNNSLIGIGYSIIGSGMQNTIYDVNPAFGEAIAAGTGNTLEYSSGNAFVGAGTGNYMAVTPSGFIGAGDSNQIAPYGTSGYTNDSAIVGGVGNTISVYASTIGGGGGNKIVPNTSFDVISGGAGNIISGALNNQLPTQGYTAISGGTGNQASGYASTISGGQQNTVSNNYDIISGGYLNAVSGLQATIGGGYGNTASGKDATIPGGSTNTAGGINSFAAGYRSSAGFNGDFVWSDYLYGSAGASATAPNQFVARATGGVYLYSSKSGTGVALEPGSGAWSTLSDRRVKTDIQNIDDERILAKLASMPISEWSYKAQGTGIRHIGPMAQDFRTAFGLGEDNRHISTVDEEGVALAAIKALLAEVAAKDVQIVQLRHAQFDARRAQSDANRRLEAKYARLEQRLDALEVHARPPANVVVTKR